MRKEMTRTKTITTIIVIITPMLGSWDERRTVRLTHVCAKIPRRFDANLSITRGSQACTWTLNGIKIDFSVGSHRIQYIGWNSFPTCKLKSFRGFSFVPIFMSSLSWMTWIQWDDEDDENNDSAFQKTPLMKLWRLEQRTHVFFLPLNVFIKIKTPRSIRLIICFNFLTNSGRELICGQRPTSDCDGLSSPIMLSSHF